MVTLQGRKDRTQHRQRSNAIEQDGRCQTVGKSVLLTFALFGDSIHQLFKVAVNIQSRTNEATDGQRNDKQHGIFGFAEMGNRGIETDGQRGQSQSRIEHFLVFLLDAAVEWWRY